MINEMNDRASLLRPQRVADDGGGFAVSYAEVADVSVGVESRSSASDRNFGSERLARRRRFVMRRRSDLIFEMRIRHRNRTYRITDIHDGEAQGRLSVVDGEEILQ